MGAMSATIPAMPLQPDACTWGKSTLRLEGSRNYRCMGVGRKNTWMPGGVGGRRVPAHVNPRRTEENGFSHGGRGFHRE